MTTDLEIRAATELRMLAFVMAKIIARRADQRLAEMGLDLNGLHMGILRMLDSGDRTLTDLSRSFVLDPSTLVPVIDTLEKKGYIERRKDPNDRRRTPLALTDAGQALMREVGWHAHHEPLIEAVQSLGPEQTQTLIQLLRQLFAALPDSPEILAELDERLHLLCSRFGQDSHRFQSFSTDKSQE